MSLLLEALKKAEKAKEEAQRSAGTDARAPIALQPEAPPAADARRVVTRDELPDISQSLEIVSDDFGQKTASAAPAPRAEEQRAAERAAAKKVFEAKFREPNPRLPFYMTLGALGFFAVCTVGYFWYQLRPPPALVNANPQPPAGEVQVAAADTKPVATPAQPSAPSSQQAIPGLPGAATPRPPAPAPALASPQRPLERAPVPKPAPRLRPAPSAAPAAPQREFAVGRAAPQVHPRVEAGYSAFVAGDLAAARSAYEQALREEPANRDALLGVAAVDVRSGRHEAAEATYLRLLQADPRDAHAQAALIALRGARVDPVAAESRVKSLLAADPGAHVLHFTLGNQFAHQGRWAEAQQEYFKALAADPENADFAYNLAVSLDHLRQPKLAREYYRRAIALAERRGSSFDPRAARAREAQLGN
jgi:tetratricopeptide (TPR) repeat protein